MFGKTQKPVELAVFCSLFAFDTKKYGEYNVQKYCKTHGGTPTTAWPWEERSLSNL